MGKKEQIIEKGSIKVAWAEKSNKMLYSKMFDSLDKAIEFSKKKKYYLIFKLIKRRGMQEFKWEVLDYGKAKLYSKLFKYYRAYGIDNFLKFID